MSTFIEDLIRVNPDAEYEKRDRWLIIAQAYIEANPGLSFKQIREGLGLGEHSSAAGSLRHALPRLIHFKKIFRKDGLPYRYFPVPKVQPLPPIGQRFMVDMRSNRTVAGTVPSDWTAPVSHM